MICAKCSRAMQWPDGAMRCDDMKIVSGKAFTECLGFVPGKCQLYNKEEADKILKKAENQKVVRTKIKPDLKIGDREDADLTPTVKTKKVGKKPAKQVSKDQMGFNF